MSLKINRRSELVDKSLAPVFLQEVFEEVRHFTAVRTVSWVQIPSFLKEIEPVFWRLAGHGHRRPQSSLDRVLQTSEEMTADVICSVLAVPQLPQNDGQAESKEMLADVISHREMTGMKLKK